MIYAKSFSGSDRLDLDDRINEWLGAQRNSSGSNGDFFAVKDTHYGITSSDGVVIHGCMIFYEVHLSEELK